MSESEECCCLKLYAQGLILFEGLAGAQGSMATTDSCDAIGDGGDSVACLRFGTRVHWVHARVEGHRDASEMAPVDLFLHQKHWHCPAWSNQTRPRSNSIASELSGLELPPPQGCPEGQ